MKAVRVIAVVRAAARAAIRSLSAFSSSPSPSGRADREKCRPGRSRVSVSWTRSVRAAKASLRRAGSRRASSRGASSGRRAVRVSQCRSIRAWGYMAKLLSKCESIIKNFDIPTN